MATKARKEREKPDFEVMKAADATENEIVFPTVLSPKVDGFRGYIRNAVLALRSGKQCANQATQKFFSHAALEGLDGELVVGSPVARDGFHATSSGLRTEKWDPRATFLVFDVIDCPSMPFIKRLTEVRKRVLALPPMFRGRVIILEQATVHDITSFLKFEDTCVDLGFEGLIARSPNGLYKHGRSTVDEQGMLKIKRFVDAEAVIIGMEQELDKSGSPKNTMGALLVRDLKTGTEFSVGTGFTWKMRSEFWQQGANVNGTFIKYKFFPCGTKSKPRHPVFVGIRAEQDMDASAVKRGRLYAVK